MTAHARSRSRSVIWTATTIARSRFKPSPGGRGLELRRAEGDPPSERVRVPQSAVFTAAHADINRAPSSDPSGHLLPSGEGHGLRVRPPDAVARRPIGQD